MQHFASIWRNEPKSRGGPVVFPFQDRSQIYATVISVALHGAVALAIAYEVMSGVGAPVPRHRGHAAMTVHLVYSEPLQGGGATLSAHTVHYDPSVAPSLDALKVSSSSVASASSHVAVGLSEGLARDMAAHAVAGNSDQTEDAKKSDYEALLRAHLQPYFVYPAPARPERLGGMVRLHIIVARNGQVLSEWVQSSSGHAVLDASALDLIHRAEPLPPLPSGVDDTLEIEVPLEYSPPQLALGV
jgi:TonB family protein